MKVIAIKNSLRLFIWFNFLKAPYRNILAYKFILIFIFLSAFSSVAQRQPAGFYDQVDKNVLADSAAKLFISSIQVIGNKKTKKYLIEREMRFKIGDSILANTIYDKIIRSKEHLYNTTLFSEVLLVPQFISATNISILVTVKEKWYIYPSLVFQLADRNINEWINTFNASLERVIYGVKFSHYNLSGRRDQLKVSLLTGYARNISVAYSAPYSNKSLTAGFSVLGSFTQNREIIYKTSSGNSPLRYKEDGFVREAFSIGGSYIKRVGYYRRQFFSFSYAYVNVSDSITDAYNPNYFNLDNNFAHIPDFNYTYQYINTNNVIYPLTGKIYTISILKRGLGFSGGINAFIVDGVYNKYFSHGKNWYTSLQTQAIIKAPFNVAYINQRALGYGNFYLQGLENYVVDGVASFLFRYTLKKKIVTFKIPFPIKNKIIPFIPFTFFAKTFVNAGSSYLPAPDLTLLGNRFLYTGGFGIDMLTLYDISLKLDYSFNQLGEKGLFLQLKGGF